MTEAFHVIVPCKSFGKGKSRLAGVLNPPARRALCEGMLAETLSLASQVAPASSIWLVSADIAPPIQYSGINLVVESRPGLNFALDDARSAIVSQDRFANILILPIDLPQANAHSIKVAINRDADVIIAPDEAGRGTNLLYLRGAFAARFGFHYGADSFTRHVKSAKVLNATCAVVDDPRLAFDLDEPSHYSRYGNMAANVGYLATES